MSDTSHVTYSQNGLDIFYRIPIVRRDLVLAQFLPILGAREVVIESLLS